MANVASKSDESIVAQMEIKWMMFKELLLELKEKKAFLFL